MAAPAKSGGMGRAFLLIAIIAIGAGVWFWVQQKPMAKLAPVTETPDSKLTLSNGVWRWAGETNLFSGVVVRKMTNGLTLARVEVSGGRANGVSETWYTNGQPETRETFTNGISQGMRERWHPNGQKKSEGMIVDGKFNGLFQSWHENGQLSERIQMSNGEPVGIAWSYYPSGFVKAETTLANGKTVTQKTWKDGETKAAQ